MSLRLALCQLAVTTNKTANIANAVTHIHRAAQGGASLVVLPECFNSPYDTKRFPEYAEPIPTGPTSRAMSEAAKEAHVTLIAGSIPEVGPDNKYYNTCVVYGPTGEVAGVFRKIHLFKIFTDQVRFDEAEILLPGQSPLVVTLPGGFRVGIGICFDIRFPLLSSYYQHIGKTHLLVYPGAFNMVTGPAHWSLTCRARALDSQQYVALCSPARDEKAGYVAYGHSMVAGPWGEIVVEADEKQGITFASVALDNVTEVQRKLPITAGYRGDLYDAWAKGSTKAKL